MIKRRFQILIFVSLLFFACIFLPGKYSGAEIIISHNSNQQENKNILNKTTGLKKIDLVFQKIFPYVINYDREDIKECVKAYTVTGKAQLKCKEHISLLRKSEEAERWSLMKNTTGYINLTIREMGIINVKAHIASIKPVSISTACYMQLFYNSSKIKKTPSSSCITGVFKRHVNDVKSYTFKDLSTGKKETLHVTPNHLFYVKNRKRFIAINQLGPADEMITLSGHRVRLICLGHKKNNCGTPREKFNISIVYNMEVHQRHEYFAGGIKIYVHNVYMCEYCQQRIYSSQLLTKHLGTHDVTGGGINCSLCSQALNINTTFKRKRGLMTHMKWHYASLAEIPYEQSTVHQIAKAKQEDKWFNVKSQWLEKMVSQEKAFYESLPFECTDCPDKIRGHFKNRSLLMRHKLKVHHIGSSSVTAIPPANPRPESFPSVPVLSPGTYELVVPIYIDQNVYTHLYVLPQYNP